MAGCRTWDRRTAIPACYRSVVAYTNRWYPGGKRFERYIELRRNVLAYFFESPGGKGDGGFRDGVGGVTICKTFPLGDVVAVAVCFRDCDKLAPFGEGCVFALFVVEDGFRAAGDAVLYQPVTS